MRITLLLILLLFNCKTMNAQTTDPWVEYLTPSGVHSLMEQYAGNFRMEITMSMGEGKEPKIVTVKSKNNMLLGGRFLEMEQKGEMMGMDYQSIITMGFNNTNKKFALTTITNMGTGILSLVGDWDQKSKTANLIGELVNPVSKQAIHVRQTVAFIDKNIILIESFDREGDRPETKTVQYKLVRE
ncbi:MAG TPA: DUF1579 family protein [Flavisolibacter sp.]|nr:DUF1579 family protein [Flavisolibacter sp.]